MIGRKIFLVLILNLSFLAPLPLPGDEMPVSLKAGVLANFPPQYSTSDTGEIQGFAIDIIEAIAEKAGISLEYVVRDNWFELTNDLEKGTIDIIPNSGITESRKHIYSYSSPLETFPISIITRKSYENLTGINDLKGKKVAVVSGNIGEFLIKDIETESLIIFDHPESALFDLLSGNSDALIFPEPVVFRLARQIHIDNRIKSNGPVLTEIKRGISVLKGNEWILERLNPVIRDFIRTREYRDIYTKWYGKPTPFWDIKKVIIFMSFIMAFLTLILFVWKYYSTEAQVKKRTEELLFQNQLIEHAHEGIIAVDLSGFILSWNLGAEKIFGYKNNEVTGKQYKILCGDEYNGNICDLFSADYSAENWNSDLEIQFIKKDKSVFWGNISISTLKKEEDIIGFIFIVRDITRRREAAKQLREIEKRNQALLDTSPVCHMIVDLDFNLHYMSSAGYKMFKLNKAADVYGRSFPFRFFPDPFREEMVKYLNKVKMSCSVIRFEALASDIEGNDKWFANFLMPVFSDDNKIEYIVIVLDDITERKKMEEHLRHMEKMDAVGHLAGGVAHDFNNQLTGVLGYADLLLKSVEDPVLKKYAENICTSAKRSSDLTKKLLTFSRKGKYRNEQVNINKLISETAELLLRSVNKKITIHQDINARSSVISGDPSQLQNALLNLGINASDAMPDGGVLTFRTEIILIDKNSDNPLNQILKDGSYLRITVNDTGTGIAHDDKVHIFEPFFTTKPQGRGTGLGLSSVYGAVKQHNGIITFESEAGKGTNFYIYLPFAEEIIEEKNFSMQSDNNKDVLNILVAEDEESVRDLLCEMLLLSGHNVTTCTNGREAVEHYKEKWKEIDIVILDMIMPEMDGRDSFRAMKKINPEIKVVLCTGYSDDKNTRCMLEEGVLDIINKPFNLSRLLDVIGRITDNKTPIIS